MAIFGTKLYQNLDKLSKLLGGLPGPPGPCTDRVKLNFRHIKSQMKDKSIP